MNVVLDFGHGGIDWSGKYTTAPSKMHTFSDGTVAYEGVLNRQIGGMLKLMLGKYNVSTTVDANDPRDISLPQRVRKVNVFTPSETILVSIHCNASKNHNAGGFEIYTTRRKNNSDKLAESIASSVEKSNLGLKMRFDYSDGDKDKEKDFYLINKANCPSVLVECGFFDYRPDYDKLSNPCFQKDMAYSIYKGIKNYIESNI